MENFLYIHSFLGKNVEKSVISARNGAWMNALCSVGGYTIGRMCKRIGCALNNCRTLHRTQEDGETENSSGGVVAITSDSRFNIQPNYSHY